MNFSVIFLKCSNHLMKGVCNYLTHIYSFQKARFHPDIKQKAFHHGLTMLSIILQNMKDYSSEDQCTEGEDSVLAMVE